MTFYLPSDKILFLVNIKGIKITKEGDMFRIDMEPTTESLIDLFYAGADYGVHKLNNYLYNQKLEK